MHIEDIQLCKENQNGGGWGGEESYASISNWSLSGGNLYMMVCWQNTLP
jgi:hypothetical protein